MFLVSLHQNVQSSQLLMVLLVTQLRPQTLGGRGGGGGGGGREGGREEGREGGREGGRAG